MPGLTPLDDNRQEHFLNGEDLEPITRREHFYAGRESELPAGHQDPETREEWFIQKYRGGGGDVTVVPLSVTENGTYSEEGKAYSPVSVNVPLPQNAYLLKSVSNLPQPIASFSDGEDMVMPSLKVAIEPQQDLHGYDSPWVGGSGKNKWSNVWSDYTKPRDYYIYPIALEQGAKYTISASKKTTVTGCAVGFVKDGDRYDNFDSFDIVVNPQGDISNYIPKTYTIDNSYVSPKLVIYCANETVFNQIFENYNIMIEKSETATSYAPYSNICPISGWTEVDVTVADDVENPTVSNVYTIDLDGTRYGVDLDVINGIGREYKEYPSYNGETLIGPWISDRDAYAEGTTPTIGAQVVDKGDISTFNTIPTAVKSLRGVNNVWADTGDITDAEYFSKEV